jgi:MOSC domain-containing protein YiiM
MEEQQTIKALEGVGLEGDRYALGKGAYSNSKRITIRQVSFIEIEKFNEANNELEEKFTLAETRRNIVTEGVELNDLVGKEFFVGEVRLLGIELCTPCKRPEKLANKKGFEKAFEGRGGLRAEVMTEGIISVGDEIVV